MIPITIWTHIAAVLLGAAIAFGGAWQIQDWRLGGQIDAIRAEQAAQHARSLADARAMEQAYNHRLQEAQDAATKRETKLRADAAAARRTADGLRDSIYSIRAELPRYTLAAAAQTADTAIELLGICADEYRNVAEQADRHAADAVMLRDAWPKQP